MGSERLGRAERHSCPFPVVQINDNDLHLVIQTKTANVVQSLGTPIWQYIAQRPCRNA
jgi:hypothetical protein